MKDQLTRDASGFLGGFPRRAVRRRFFSAPRLKQGFSLVEVTLALGIMATCGIVLLGLLSVGLNSFQHSEELSTGGAIRDQISNSLQQAGWAGDMYRYFGVNSTGSNASTTWVNSGSPTSQTEYFDDQANLLTLATGAVFQAVITPVVPGSPDEEYSQAWTGPTAVAGAGPAASPSLMEFQIVISRAGVPTTSVGSTVTYIVCVGHN